MRYLAIDYGEKRLGLALSDPSETIVSPLRQIAVSSGRFDQVWPVLRDIVGEYGVAALVVGLPLLMDGREGAQARRARRFAQALEREVLPTVHLQDERLSSHAAEEVLSGQGLTSGQRRRRRDMLAACEILREFLQRRRRGQTTD
ncbi:MAG: Holliday junction resolvase RuvX [Sedimentisphaerales bacterium]|nr:Holliday junction resolvase RuvX [Sedimentisphaerales bacterium]